MNKTPYRVIAIMLGVALLLVIALWVFTQSTTFGQSMFIMVNIFSLLCYAYDKYRAVQKTGTRVPEPFMHTLAAIGGSPGAFIGQHVFDHKKKKRSFQNVFWIIVVLQLIVLLLIYFLR